MSADTLTPLLSARWRKSPGARVAGTPLPGLDEEAIERLSALYPITFNTETRKLLQHSCGIAGTALGDIDFTGQWYPEEPLAVFRPNLLLCIDSRGRRWLAEGASDDGLPGPVWCLLPAPQVAIFVASDLAKFIYALREREERDSVRPWLQGHIDAARMIWEHRLSLAAHCRTSCRTDRALRGWVDSLPAGALVYDVREPERIRGWPYGIAAEHGYLSRCGKLPVFAVASPIEVRAAARDQYHARAELEYATPGASS